MKISNELKEKALKLGRKVKASTVYVNVKEEVFTDEGLVKASVGNDKEKYGKVEITAAVETAGTNDLGKVEEVLAAIEAATDSTLVESILNAENAGKKRITVLNAAQKKLETLTKQE